MTLAAGNPSITPFLWFDQNAEEAVDFYVSVFPNSRRLEELRNTGDAPGLKGGILTLAFELNGLKFIALNGGPAHQFNEAVSFVVNCENQQEIDYYWSKLTDGGAPHRLRLAQRQVRPPLADHSHAHRRTTQKLQGHAGHDEHDQTRHCRTRTRRRILEPLHMLP